ncbi:MAG: hypothetical protein JWM11_4215 [Planctomycetaceae bacterium]|nr:hypothetical protein [Planctomycetaceae bacterium]
MISHLHSYLIATTEDPWEGMQRSSGPVDCLLDCDVGTIVTLIDYLETESRIPFPRLPQPITRGNCTVISQLTRHQAKVLRTRIAKHRCPSLSQIMMLYGKERLGSNEWSSFVSRQHTLFVSDEQQLVLVVISSISPLIDFPMPHLRRQ